MEKKQGGKRLLRVSHLHVGEENRGFEQGGGTKSGGDRKARRTRDREPSRRHRLVPRSYCSGEVRHSRIRLPHIPSPSLPRPVIVVMVTGARALGKKFGSRRTALGLSAAEIYPDELRITLHLRIRFARQRRVRK